MVEHGYWHARSLAYTATPLARTLEWLRMPGDMVFIFAGAAPLTIAMAWGYVSLEQAARDPADTRACSPAGAAFKVRGATALTAVQNVCVSHGL